MNKTFTVAILGVGARGFTYGRLMHADDRYEVVALCDCNKAQIDTANALFNLSEDNIFYDEQTFFEQKRADVLVIGTYDKYHVPQCLKALQLGYDILLEKPVSDSVEEIETLLDAQKKIGKKVVVCHVLRYSPLFIKVGQLLEEGKIGKLMAIDAIERVRYWHQAQAYVRLQSQFDALAHPTILAKCCHDLDYIQHYAGAPCDTVTSTGGLSFFRKENAPKGATLRCLDCPHVETCAYSAKKIYVDRWKAAGCPTFVWPYNKVLLTDTTTEAGLYEGLRTGPLGKCAFLCGVEENEHVVDHQMVQMHFQNGVDAHLNMLFTGDPGGRRVTLFGTLGEIVLEERDHRIELRRYGQEPEFIGVDDIEMQKLLGYGHGGGDFCIVRDLYDILVGQKEKYTSLTESLESHLIGIKAEESRLNGSVTLKVHE